MQHDFAEKAVAEAFYAEIEAEVKNYPFAIPDEWLSKKFRQLHLEAYVQNFTLNNPLKNNGVR
mgnify:CR=1 FL=1